MSHYQFAPLPSASRDGFVPTREEDILLSLALGQIHIGAHALEFGTFSGRTAIQLARALVDHIILTIDIPPGTQPRLPIDLGDAKFLGEQPSFPELEGSRIIPIHADSADIEFPPTIRAGFVFIDGAHSFEYALNDFIKAIPACVPGALLVFHDANWPGVGLAIQFLIEATPWLHWQGWEHTSLCWVRLPHDVPGPIQHARILDAIWTLLGQRGIEVPFKRPVLPPDLASATPKTLTTPKTAKKP